MKITLIIVTPVLLLACVVWTQQVDPKQKRPDILSHDFADTLAGRYYDLDSLKAIIGDNKGLPPDFEMAAAVALSAYPELKDVNIDMILTQGGAPMESSFKIWSMFGSGRHRKYRILLNDAENTFFDPILLRSLPFDAQVGILAHELGHVVYYHRLSLLQIAKWGLKYVLDADFRATHERSTDLMPVYHGLGSQIYQYAWYVRHSPNCRSFYAAEKSFMDRYYMTDEELLTAIGRR